MKFYDMYYSIPYIFFFVLTFVFSIGINNKNHSIQIYKSGNLFLVYSVSFFFVFFIGFRGFIYTDWSRYYEAYVDTPTIFSSASRLKLFLKNYNNWGVGFLWYSILIKTICSNYFFFQFISFLIDYLILFVFLHRYLIKTQLVSLAFLFFFLFGGVLGFGIEVNLLRNSKAIMLFLLSVKYIEIKKLIPFLFLNFLGFTFHSTALLFIPLYFILTKNIARKLIFIIFLIGNLVYFLELEWIKEFLRFINNSIHTPFYDLIEVYLRMQKYSGKWGFTIGFIERSFTFFLVFFFEKKLVSYNSKNNLVIKSLYIYCFVYLYCSEMSIILNRVGLLFIFSYWIIYPQIYMLLSNKKKYLFLVILLLYGILKCATCNSVLFYYENALLPHKSFNQRYYIMNQFNRFFDQRQGY